MSEKNNIRVGISMGDFNGVGLEVILKTFEDTRMLELCTPVLFASNKIVSFFKRHFGLEQPFNGVTRMQSVINGKMNVMNCWKDMPLIEFGKQTPVAGQFAFESLQKAVECLKNGEIDVLVTAPINKENIQSEAFHFPGHTDYLAQELGGDSLMFLVSDELRVGLLTDHVPLSQVTPLITKELIFKKVRLLNESLQKDFSIDKPKIALLGLNPHCGDGGVIGNQDDEILRPAVQELFNQGILVFGPYSADSFFVSEYKNFDAVIAPYHDQGLIPFKTLTFGTGVNFTAGLEKIRTCPDHGTAYAIAGKGIADESSFRQAVYAAIDIFQNRKQNLELQENALKKEES